MPRDTGISEIWNCENHHVVTCIGNRVNATFIPDYFDHVLIAVDIMILFLNIGSLLITNIRTFAKNMFFCIDISPTLRKPINCQYFPKHNYHCIASTKCSKRLTYRGQIFHGITANVNVAGATVPLLRCAPLTWQSGSQARFPLWTIFCKLVRLMDTGRIQNLLCVPKSERCPLKIRAYFDTIR